MNVSPIDINGTDTDGIKSLVANVAKTAISFGALFAVGMIVLSGIRYTTSVGEDENVKKAKSTGLYAVI
jgi:Type IV secretion system pilin